jgi:excinuclease ABC subunit A
MARAPAEVRRWVLEGEPEWKSWRKSWPGTWYGVAVFFQWLETKAYKMHVRVLLSKYRAYTPCTSCGGSRLKSEAQAWRLGTAENANAVLAPEQRVMPMGAKFDGAVLRACPVSPCTISCCCRSPRAHLHRCALAAETDRRRNRLAAHRDPRAPGLPVRSRARLSHARSPVAHAIRREVQRINLTTALGTSLVNTLFVLDEPSIGLHPRDMGRVIEVMHKLRDAGNSLVVVEHDPQIMLAADRILDMGPGPGERGGEIVYFGDAQAIRSAPQSLTGDYLAGRKHVGGGAGDSTVRTSTADSIEIFGATEHNLKAVDVRIPLKRLVCVTGVSGSGKSTLIQDVLYAALLKAKGKPTEAPGKHERIAGAGKIADVILVDQSPIGRTTRSNPASYVGAFDCIRKLFVQQPIAKERKYTPGTFSFNSGNGRCPTCSGNGFEHVEMQFLSDVYLRCPDCNGRRYRDEILEVKIAGRSIADVPRYDGVRSACVFCSERRRAARAAAACRRRARLPEAGSARADALRW